MTLTMEQYRQRHLAERRQYAAGRARKGHSARILKALGNPVTPTGLDLLAKAAARADGVVKGSFGANPGSARSALVAKGFVGGGLDRYDYVITDAGRALVARARELGW